MSAIRSIVEMYTHKRDDLLLKRWDGGLEDAEVHTVEVDNLVEALESAIALYLADYERKPA